MASKLIKTKAIKPFKPAKLPAIPWNPYGHSIPRRRVDMKKRARAKEVPREIIKGDLVQVISGKDEGKQGKVVKVKSYKTKVLVEGVNTCLIRRPVKEGSGESVKVVLKMMPIPMDNVALVDPTDKLPCRTVERYTQEGRKVRVSTRSGRIIPKPRFEKPERGQQDGSYDTTTEAVEHVTYVPSLLYFHEEILLSLNVKPTIPKREPDKRDLIFKHIEKEIKQDSTLPAEQQLTIYKPSAYLQTYVFVMTILRKISGFLFPHTKL